MPTLVHTNAAQTIRPFIGRAQLSAIGSACRGEEREFFKSKLIEMAQIVDSMPETYGQDGLGERALVHLHYFTAGCDFYITEKDAGSPDDSPEQAQSQAFGMADLGYGGELGYISLPEILAAGAELDLYWQPRTIADCRKG